MIDSSFFREIYFLREDTLNKKVYIYKNGFSSERILYDFSFGLNDTIKNNWYRYYNGFYVGKIDSTLIKSNWHRVLIFTDGASNFAPIIEGIGSLAGHQGTPWFFEGGNNLICHLRGIPITPYYTSTGRICKLFNYTGIVNHKNNADVKIIGVPVRSASKLILNSKNEFISNFKLYDSRGIMNYDSGILKVHEVSLNGLVSTKGFYYYLIETTGGKLSTGKLIY